MNIINFNNFDYHFFGKECLIDRNLFNLDNLKKSLQLKNCNYQEILFLNQVHSSEVVVIDDYKKIYKNSAKPSADAIITNLKNIALAVVTADCSPILLFEANSSIISAIHCGWRGAIGNIIANTIKKIIAISNQPNHDIYAFIGPMIQQKSYQISQDFYDDFIKKNQDNKKFFIPDKVAEKYLFDLNYYVVEELKNNQVSHIENLQIDTFTDNNFFSFRRAKIDNLDDCGRNISLIALR